MDPERTESALALLVHQLKDPLIYVLLIAAAVTAAFGDYMDTGVIVVVVLLDALIGFVQEYRAREAMRSLASMAAPQADVVRAGERRTIESRELVPGDLVLLSSGVRVPADLRLTTARALEIDESALTGESIATAKRTEPLADPALVPGDRGNMAFAGTTVTRGRGRGVVTSTGRWTELGRIAQATREVGQTETPLQQKLQRFGRAIGVGVAGLWAVVVAVGLMRGLPAGEIFITAVAMAVSAIPEGLPVVLTITLAIGVRRMAKRNAIVRALPAVETLGSTTVIGSDKTGTLTRNEMTVRRVHAGGRTYEVTGIGYQTDGWLELEGHRVGAVDHPALWRTIEAAVLANEADATQIGSSAPAGDPTEVALHVVAAKAGEPAAELRRRYRQLDILPFESERRMMATLDESAEGRRVHVKGAPEAVLPLCGGAIQDEGVVALDEAAVHEGARAMAGRGLRVLATAYLDTDAGTLEEAGVSVGPYTFAGLLGMEDPVRPESFGAVAQARASGIRVLMLTGDHLETARAVGAELGLGNAAVSGRELEGLSDEALDRVLESTNVYARVAPEQKLRIVQRLKGRGEVVAVTGDGVNDAPALRAAHLGIAMGKGGTDAAREASDMVLADDNFATITAAVEEGRIVFSNIRKVTFFLLSTGVGEVVTILAALLLGWPLPFVASQILWINLVTNGFQDVALAFEPAEPGLSNHRPRPVNENVLSRRLLPRLGVVGMILAAGTLAVFWWTLRTSGDLVQARTVATTQMVVFQFFHVFNCRSLDRSIFRVPLLSNRFLFVSLVAAWLAHLAVLHVPLLQTVFRTVPLSAGQWGSILLVGATVIVGGEVDKAWNRWRGRGLG